MENTTHETENVVTENTTTTPTDETTSQNMLFGSITYQDDTAYEEFISNMNIGQAIFVLMASAKFSQSLGAFSILESETISTAIRTIKKNSETEKEKAEEPAN